MILLSFLGERHEDRIPEGIFTSLNEAVEFILEDPNVSFIETFVVQSDYDNEAVEIYCYDHSKDKSDSQKEFDNYYIAEFFNVNNRVIESKPKEKSELSKLLGFK